MNSTFARSLALLTGILLPVAAFAHPGHAGGSVFLQGFVHPFTGVDHLLAMLATGMWAAQLGGRARWQVPAVFVGMMMLGALVGMETGAALLVESGIVTSVVVLGVLVATGARVPALPGAVVVAAFAALHGHAHGAEIAAAANSSIYIAGFVLATVMSHAFAVGAAALLQTTRHVALVQIAGALVAVGGAVLFAL